MRILLSISLFFITVTAFADSSRVECKGKEFNVTITLDESCSKCPQYRLNGKIKNISLNNVHAGYHLKVAPTNHKNYLILFPELKRIEKKRIYVELGYFPDDVTEGLYYTRALIDGEEFNGPLYADPKKTLKLKCTWK